MAIATSTARAAHDGQEAYLVKECHRRCESSLKRYPREKNCAHEQYIIHRHRSYGRGGDRNSERRRIAWIPVWPALCAAACSSRR